MNNVILMKEDMSRYSYDALLLQARLGVDEMMTIREIAQFVFHGVDPTDPRKLTKVSMARALRAASNLATMRRVEPIPNRKMIQAVRSLAASGGVQAEAVMNLVVRGGPDRRKNPPHEIEGDRRAAPEPSNVVPIPTDEQDTDAA